MAYYNIDTDKFINDNVPTRKRLQLPALAQLVKGLLAPFTRLVNILINYKEGTADQWMAGNYNKGDIVAYNGQVFEAIVDTSGSTPDVKSDWRLLFTMWRGTNEAQKYNGTVMQFEYALNKYWGLNYVASPTASDIYITTNTIPTPQFFVSTIDTQSSFVGLSTPDSWVGLSYTYATIPESFTLHVPLVWYLTLSTDPDLKIRSFADNYVTEGVTYNITTY